MIEEILGHLIATQAHLDREVERLSAEGRERFQYTLDACQVVFERQVRRLPLAQCTGILAYLSAAPIGFVLSAPPIYGPIVPMVLLDLSLTLYQQVRFRIYGIPRVRRADYPVMDRYRLAYLNGIERLNCIYCGYANQPIE
jgi:hypothetical protein